MRSRPLYDVVALLARLGIGVVFMAHGWQKIEVGITATGRWFDEMGVPFPTGAAVYSTFAELLGGTLLIAGIGLPIVGALLFVDMLGALVFVHAGNGLFLVDETGTVARNGYELVVVLGVASLLLAVADGGRLSLEHILFDGGGPGGSRLRRSRRSREEEEDDGQSFVEALRAAEEAPAAAPDKPKKSSSRNSGKGGSSGLGGSASASSPTLPQAAARPSSSSSTGRDARLASDIVSGTKGTKGTEDDTLVAGRRKSPRKRRSDTQPMRRNSGGDQASSS